MKKPLLYKGETRSQAAWARARGLNPVTVHRRLQLGWSVEKALETPPPDKPTARYEFEGEQLTRSEIAERAGVSREAVRRAILEDRLDQVGKGHPGRPAKRVTACGESRTLSEWAEHLEMKLPRLRTLLYKTKTSQEEVLENIIQLKRGQHAE